MRARRTAKTRRGLALITILLFSSLLLVLTLAVVRAASVQAEGAVQHVRRLAAQYAAEAGLSQALSAFRTTPGWTAGFPTGQSTHYGEGSYRIVFNHGAAPQAGESVNNLTGAAPIPGPKGPVPAGSAYLVVSGQSGMTVRCLEVVVSQRLADGISSPLMADGPLDFHGDMDVSALSSRDGTTEPVRVHSNFLGAAGSPTVSWSPEAGSDSLRVAGNVTASDPRPAAAVFALGAATTPRFSAQNVLTPPDIDVAGEVAAHSGSPVTYTAGQTTLGPGTFKIGSNSSYGGNLVLKPGTTLYVDGNFTVTGSLSGQGSIYVNGDVQVNGATEVHSDDKLALAAQGNVTLKGFNGSKWLNDLPGAAPVLHQIDQITTELDNQLADPEGTPPTLPTSWLNMPSTPGFPPPPKKYGQWGTFDSLLQQLGGDHHSDGSSPRVFFHDMPDDRIGKLIEIANAAPASSEKSFVLQRLGDMKKFLGWNSPGVVGTPQDRRDWFIDHPGLERAGAADGLVDYIGDRPAKKEAALRALRNLMASWNVDSLGHAQFEGLVYAHGTIHAKDEIIVRGALIAAGRGSDSRIQLDRGSRVVFIRDFFNNGSNSVPLTGVLGIRHWAWL